MDEALKLHGEVCLTIKKNGKVIAKDESHNLIVDVGRQRLAKLFGGDVTGGITKIGVGTGMTAATTSDTALTNPIYLPVTSKVYDGAQVKFNFSIGSSDANGVSIGELGLFFDDGTMFSHKVRESAIPKASDIEMDGYWKISF